MLFDSVNTKDFGKAWLTIEVHRDYYFVVRWYSEISAVLCNF